MARKNPNFGALRQMSDGELSRQYTAAKLEMKAAENRKRSAADAYHKADRELTAALSRGTATRAMQLAYKEAKRKSSDAFKYVAALDDTLARMAEELRQRRAARTVKKNPGGGRQNAGFGALRQMSDGELSRQYTAAKLEMKAAENRKKSAYSAYLKADRELTAALNKGTATQAMRNAYKEAERKSSDAFKYVAALDDTLARMAKELRQRRAARTVKKNPGGGTYRHKTAAQLEKDYQRLYNERAMVRSKSDKAYITKKMRTIEKILGRRIAPKVAKAINGRADIVRIVRDQIRAGRTVTQMKAHLKSMGLSPKHLKEAADIYKAERSYVRSMAAGKYVNGRHRNLDHKDADHPIEVTRHYRSGPPGYLTPWQRAAAMGQKELFDTGIKLAKTGTRKNPTIIKRAKYVMANPAATGARAAAAKELHKKFSGKVSKRSRVLHVAPRTPKQLAQLGRLVSITTSRGKIKLPRRNPDTETLLCADPHGNLHLASTQEYLGDFPKGDLGTVLEIEYLAAKPHLGHEKQTLFYHEMGEEGGRRPHLISDGEGHLVFRGGDYTIEAEGIRN